MIVLEFLGATGRIFQDLHVELNWSTVAGAGQLGAILGNSGCQSASSPPTQYCSSGHLQGQLSALNCLNCPFAHGQCWTPNCQLCLNLVLSPTARSPNRKLNPQTNNSEPEPQTPKASPPPNAKQRYKPHIE